MVFEFLLWPFRKVAGLYMLATYRHRDRCQVHGVIRYTDSDRPVACFEVRHGGVQIGLVIKRRRRWVAFVPGVEGSKRLHGEWLWRASAVRAVQRARDEERAFDGVGVVATRRPY